MQRRTAVGRKVFFLKKEPKTFFQGKCSKIMSIMNKSFLLLFFQKRSASFFLHAKRTLRQRRAPAATP
jgi:hypothetical protein